MDLEKKFEQVQKSDSKNSFRYTLGALFGFAIFCLIALFAYGDGEHNQKENIFPIALFSTMLAMYYLYKECMDSKNIAYIGDGLIDLPLMEKASFFLAFQSPSKL